MASLSNINGLFDVHSTGAILFSTSHGTSGQILRSNGNAAPTWVAASTVIGGPYVPIAGDVTINGYITLAAGKILTVGGNLFVTGTSTLTGALSGSTGAFSSTLTVGGNLTVTGNQYFNGEFIEGDGKEMFRYSNTWLRINEDNDFADGIYCGTGILRTDGRFEVGSGGTKFLVTAAGAVTALGNITAPTFNGLAINTTGTNNVANQIVRTDVNGYANFGWINTISGASSGTITRIYASQDAYVRYMTPATFRTQITDPYYAPTGTVSGVTSVATSNGITGGTITTTGTVSLTGTYTGRWNGTTGYYIKDTRAGDITPADSTDNAMNLGFTNQVPGNGNWQSYIQMKGWSDGYTSWQIIGPSTTTAYENWYLRAGLGASWGTARQIWHTGNLPSGSGVTSVATGSGLTGGTITTTGTLSVDTTVIRTTGDQSMSGIKSFTGAIATSSTQTRNKISVWSNATEYTIGMRDSFTFGGLSNEYAMSFQMNNNNGRGFWWGDTSHTQAQGAMSLTTQGILAVAGSLKLGFGQSDTTAAAYTLQANGTVYSANGNTAAFICGPNTSYGAGTELEIGGWTAGTTVSRIRNSNGNLHIDSKSGHNMYLNHYPPGNIFVGNGGGYLQSYQQVRSPIFYDLDNTAYYGNFAANSVFNTVTFNGGTLSGTLTMNTQNALVANNYGRGVFGLYSSTRYQHLWSMGTAYKLPDDGTTTGNLYGVAWSYPSAGGAAANLSDHGMLIINNGLYRAAISNSIRCVTDMRTPIYYDSANTAYYGDFASNSNINTLTSAGTVLIGGVFANNPYNSVTGARLMFGGEGNSNYYIGTNLENYGGNYTKLDIRWHTGIRMGAQPSYGGIRFYDTETLGTEIFAIGKSGNYVQAANSLRAPIFYDSNNTTYYTDPGSTSNINALTLIGTFSGQNGYFLQSLGVGFNSGAIGGKVDIRLGAANQIGIKLNLGGHSNPTGILSYTSASMNAGGYHMVFQATPTSGSDTNMLLCNLNGNLRNRNNSYGQYSDRTIKENITDATPKLEDVKRLRIRNFNFIGDDLKQIGLIAQETEEVFPGLVETDLNPQGDMIKSLKYSVLVPILVKAMQEQQVIIDDLKSRIETLEL